MDPLTQMTETPKQLGFHTPAEWQSHSAVWLAWPYDETTFPGRVGKAEAVFVKMIGALHTSETVELIVLNEAMQKHAAGLLGEAGVDIAKINFHITEFADVWTRDYGPTFITNPQTKEQAWVKWQYNGYGKSDDPYFGLVVKDNEVFFNLRKVIDKRMFEPGLVMEGGAVEVNGQGTLLSTEQCLLNPNRNPNLNKDQTEKYLKDYLGVTKIIWLKLGLFNDHTDGHIDEVARFVAPNKIVCAYEEDEEEENFKILDDNYKVLKNAVDQDGRPFEVIKFPMPHMRYDAEHSLHATGPQKESAEAEKASVSYMNFYIGNKVVLAAAYNDPSDAKALELLQSCFPEKTIVPIACGDIVYGGGAIHCMTQQQPKI